MFTTAFSGRVAGPVLTAAASLCQQQMKQNQSAELWKHHTMTTEGLQKPTNGPQNS